MDISLQLVREDELEELLEMQKRSFQDLLDTYHDHDTSPALESPEKLRSRFTQPGSTYFFIVHAGMKAGAVRVMHIANTDTGDISPLFIIPECRNLRLGHEAVRLVERAFPSVCTWKIGTILQETRLCHFYETLGYRDTGRRKPVKDGMDIIFYEKIREE